MILTAWAKGCLYMIIVYPETIKIIVQTRNFSARLAKYHPTYLISILL